MDEIRDEAAAFPPGPRPGVAPGSGLFGPSSVSWRVHSDPLLGLAALRALLLQALHPVTMDAVDQHSDFREDPWHRLHKVTEFVGTVTFGTASDALTAASRLRAVHARVVGRTSTGEEYAADDPQLLAWVHCCFVASFLELVTRGGARLTGVEQDAYVAEQARAAMLVGLEPEEVPHDRAGLVDYFRVIRPALVCSPSARDAAVVVVHTPPVHEVPGRTGRVPHGPDGSPRPTWVSVAGLAYATLPPWARRLYDLTRTPGLAGLGDEHATTALRSLRAALAGDPELAAPAVHVTGRGGRPARP